MKKDDNFNVVIFAIKGFLSIQNLTGRSMVPLSCFSVAYFGKKKNLKTLPVDILEAFGRYESHF